jgi:hypothetical protein
MLGLGPGAAQRCSGSPFIKGRAAVDGNERRIVSTDIVERSE